MTNSIGRVMNSSQSLAGAGRAGSKKYAPATAVEEALKAAATTMSRTAYVSQNFTQKFMFFNL